MKNHLSLSPTALLINLEDGLTWPATKILPLEDQDDEFPEDEGFTETPIRCEYDGVLYIENIHWGFG